MAVLRSCYRAVLTLFLSVVQKQGGVNGCLTQGRDTNLGSSWLG